MKAAALLIALLAACTNDASPAATTSGVGKLAVDMCGPPPTLPNVTVTYEQRGNETIAIVSNADFEAIEYYEGINALWTSCVVDLP